MENNIILLVKRNKNFWNRTMKAAASKNLMLAGFTTPYCDRTPKGLIEFTFRPKTEEELKDPKLKGRCDHKVRNGLKLVTLTIKNGELHYA